MSKKLSILVVLCMLLTSFSGLTLVTQAVLTGAGTDEEPYLIASAEDFDNIRNAPSAVYSLMADIELPETYEPFVFSGKLIGSDPENLKTIHVTINKRGENDVGLFKQIAGGVQIKNIKLTGSVIGNNNTGGFFGSASTSNKTTAGSAVENCVNDADITGYNKVGGIGGSSYGAGTLTLNHVTNTGYVNGGTGPRVGGIAGLIDITLTNAANHGSVNGGAQTGGIVGWSYGNISGSYNSGSVKGTSKVGGIVGDLDKVNLKIENCYNNGDIMASSSDDTSGGILGYTGRTGTSVANCYSTGKVTDGGNFNPVYSNAGDVKATVSNSFYLSINNQDDGVTGTEAKTLAEMKALTASLGSAYEAPAAEGYPFPEIKGNLNTSGYRLYSIVVTAGENGTVSPSGEQYVKGGETFTVTVTPGEGYAVDFVKYNSTPVDVTADGTYTTPKITADALIDVAFVLAKVPEEVKSETNVFNGIEGSLPFGIAFATVSLGDTLQEYGILFSKAERSLDTFKKDAEGVFTGKAVTAANAKGQYGIKFTGNLESGTYYTRAYAVYGENIVYSDEIIPIVIP